MKQKAATTPINVTSNSKNSIKNNNNNNNIPPIPISNVDMVARSSKRITKTENFDNINNNSEKIGNITKNYDSNTILVSTDLNTNNTAGNNNNIEKVNPIKLSKKTISESSSSLFTPTIPSEPPKTTYELEFINNNNNIHKCTVIFCYLF